MAERAALLGSTSWRLTAPLRAASDRIRRARRDPQRRRKPEPSDPAAPRRVLRLAGKSGHIPHGSGTPERSLSGTPGRSDLGCDFAIDRSGQEAFPVHVPGPPAAGLYPQGAGERPVRPGLLHHPPPGHALDFPALSGATLRHHRRARASAAEPGFLRLDLPALQSRRPAGRRPALPALRRDRTPRDPGHQGAARARAGTGASDAACRRRPGRHCGPRCGGACLLP